jgi:uncharacterized LabA/DUF88 family protein
MTFAKEYVCNNNYAFIDSQNLYLSIKWQGWELDWKRFRVYLKDKYKCLKAFIFIGYVPWNQNLYTALQEYWYIIIFKPTLELKDWIIKWNVDAELVLHTMIEYNNFDEAVIVSWDGDFYCLIEYLIKNKKLFKTLIPNKNKYSSLLKKFYKNLVFLNHIDLKKKIWIIKTKKEA